MQKRGGFSSANDNIATIKGLLSQHINNFPDTIQFTKDRKYEEAWIVPLTASKPSAAAIKSYLNREPFQIIIVEYIWNSQNDTKRFVLTLFLDQKCRLQEPGQFIHICLDLFSSRPGFAHLLEILDTQVIGHPYLFTYPPEAVNMGIFNHWLSVGPVDLWQRGEPYDSKVIADKIHERPDIEQSALNYQGLLFRFNAISKENGPYYGLKTPCCTIQGDRWVVDFPTVDYWMKLLL